MKRALLILIGGRQVPNLLTAIGLRPDIIVPIASREAMAAGGEWEEIRPALGKLCPTGLRDPIVVDAYAPSESYMACLESLMADQDAEWVVNITCGSKIMGIGAYDAAMPMNLPMPVSILYLNTAARQVITLKGRPPENDLFALTVADYFAAYGRSVDGYIPSTTEVRLARLIAGNASYANALARAARNPEKAGDRMVYFLPPSNLNQLLKMLRAAGFISSYQIGKRENRRGYGPGVACQVQPATDKSLRRFLTGDWLEVYTWWSASQSGAFDDLRCRVSMEGLGAGNEIDLAATRSASVLIAECKTENTDFKRIKERGYLEKLHSIADLVGGNYVQRLLITTLPIPVQEDELKSYESFCNQAAARRVVVVTGDKLMELPEILSRVSGARGNPGYPTI